MIDFELAVGEEAVFLEEFAAEWRSLTGAVVEGRDVEMLLLATVYAISVDGGADPHYVHVVNGIECSSAVDVGDH